MVKKKLKNNKRLKRQPQKSVKKEQNQEKPLATKTINQPSRSFEEDGGWGPGEVGPVG